jgi:hypothetical protein
MLVLFVWGGHSCPPAFLTLTLFLTLVVYDGRSCRSPLILVFVRPFSSCTKDSAGAPPLFLRSLEKEGWDFDVPEQTRWARFRPCSCLFPGYSIKSPEGAPCESPARKWRVWAAKSSKSRTDGTTFAVPHPPMYPRFRNEGTSWAFPKNPSLRKNLSTIS